LPVRPRPMTTIRADIDVNALSASESETPEEAPSRTRSKIRSRFFGGSWISVSVSKKGFGEFQSFAT
jgi:hypothetical protein